MKRLLFLTLIMAFITAVMVFAEEGILIFTYETALEAAVENSNQPALDDYNIKARQSALEDAREEAKKYFYGGTPQDAAERNIIKQVNPLVAETEVEIAQRRKQDNQEQMKTDVYVEMMRVLLAQESVGLIKFSISFSDSRHVRQTEVWKYTAVASLVSMISISLSDAFAFKGMIS